MAYQSSFGPSIYYLKDENLWKIEDEYGGSIKVSLAQLNQLLIEAEEQQESWSPIITHLDPELYSLLKL